MIRHFENLMLWFGSSVASCNCCQPTIEIRTNSESKDFPDNVHSVLGQFSYIFWQFFFNHRNLRRFRVWKYYLISWLGGHPPWIMKVFFKKICNERGEKLLFARWKKYVYNTNEHCINIIPTPYTILILLIVSLKQIG